MTVIKKNDVKRDRDAYLSIKVQNSNDFINDLFHDSATSINRIGPSNSDSEINDEEDDYDSK